MSKTKIRAGAKSSKVELKLPKWSYSYALNLQARATNYGHAIEL
jgi:hypothetical protein